MFCALPAHSLSTHAIRLLCSSVNLAISAGGYSQKCLGCGALEAYKHTGVEAACKLLYFLSFRVFSITLSSEPF